MSGTNWKRTGRCAELNDEYLGQEVILKGWADHQRDLGGLVFITLRDRSGMMQLLIDEESPASAFETAQKVRAEYVVEARGIYQKRQDPNPDMPTGDYELHVSDLRIVNRSKTPPFYIEENSDTKDSLRLEHRYLDLRRPDMMRTLMLRSKVSGITRRYFEEEGFVDVETPMLGKSTPEGARDYLVPSRVFPGYFFALPQSPQLYKQLLMVAGVDRYIQIAKCFRDEDLRADRQPEFTQIDFELSFTDEEEIMAITEGFLARVMREVKGIELELPLPRLTWEEAMTRFGSDKPDLRFGMELKDISDAVKGSSFRVFTGALEAGGSVQCIVVPGAGDSSRKVIDYYTEDVRRFQAKGLAWFSPGDEPRGSINKFFTPEELRELGAAAGAEDGDLVLIVADQLDVVRASLGGLRQTIAKENKLIPEDSFNFTWVTEFPLFEYSEEEDRYVSKHHPFTQPMDEDLELLDSDQGKVRSRAYDIVCNGYELGGGSLRIHDPELQERMFTLLGFSAEEARSQFDFLLQAFEYGVPPHGGLALGFDRLVMILAGTSDIRDVIAFPKVQSSADLMTKAPGPVSEKQMEELRLKTAAGLNEKDSED